MEVVESDKDFQKVLDETMVDIKDFRKYHTHKINEASDTVAVMKIKNLHNARYDKFFEEILKPRANKDGKIRCELIARLWHVYQDSYEVLKCREFYDHLRLVDRKDVDYWLDIFSAPIEELYQYGSNVLSIGFGILSDYLRQWWLQEKWDRIYSKSDKFDDWLDLTENQVTFMSGQEAPYELKPIAEKFQIISASKI